MLFDPKNDCMRDVVILFHFTFEETEFPEKRTYSGGHICGKWWKQNRNSGLSSFRVCAEGLRF